MFVLLNGGPLSGICICGFQKLLYMLLSVSISFPDFIDVTNFAAGNHEATSYNEKLMEWNQKDLLPHSPEFFKCCEELVLYISHPHLD